MSAIMRQFNQNVMEWTAATSTSIYTDCTPVTGLRAMMFLVANQATVPLQHRFEPAFFTPDQDIAAGRVRRFATIESMISDLKSSD